MIHVLHGHYTYTPYVSVILGLSIRKKSESMRLHDHSYARSACASDYNVIACLPLSRFDSNVFPTERNSEHC